MANHTNRNWHRRWTLADDGKTATHDNGLIVTWDGHRATMDPATREIIGAKIAAEEGTDRHVGAQIYRLMTEAEKLFTKRSLQ